MVTYEGDNFDDTDAVDGYSHFQNNVCVNTMGFRLDSSAVALQYLDSVIIRGNQIWNTGHMANVLLTIIYFIVQKTAMSLMRF